MGTLKLRMCYQKFEAGKLFHSRDMMIFEIDQGHITLLLDV